jgi:hypothetical protein
MKRSIQLNITKIATRLRGMPKDKSMAFAARSALRVLPLLMTPKQPLSDQQDEAFWYWKAASQDFSRKLKMDPSDF